MPFSRTRKVTEHGGVRRCSSATSELALAAVSGPLARVKRRGARLHGCGSLLLALLLGLSCAQQSRSIPRSNCSLGLDAPTDFAAFSPQSPWRTPIDADGGVHPDSKRQLETLRRVLENEIHTEPVLRISVHQWTAPIHFIDSELCPLVSVTSTGGLHESVDPDGNGRVDGIPMPEGAWADPEEDGHMVLVDARRRMAWEFSPFGKSGLGDWTTSTHAKWDLDELGTLPPFSGERWWRAGSTGSGAPLIGGIITLSEMQRKRIDHALGIALATTRKNGSTSMLSGSTNQRRSSRALFKSTAPMCGTAPGASVCVPRISGMRARAGARSSSRTSSSFQSTAFAYSLASSRRSADPRPSLHALPGIAGRRATPLTPWPNPAAARDLRPEGL